MSMTRESCKVFADAWATAWNRRDVESVLAHFHEDIVFTSPTALVVTGHAVISGKTALREYWNKALAQSSSLRFSVDHIVWDPVHRVLAIIYRADINGRSRRVSENLRFNEAEQVISAEVFHGVPAQD